MKIKICGLTQKENIREILTLKPELAGFIFYNGSSRCFQLQDLGDIEFGTTKKTGVFVNEGFEKIIKTALCFRLDYIQLHGNEKTDDCCKLKKTGFKIIKAFSVSDDFNFELTRAYADNCDYFLFDTKGKEHGGTGKKFNWDHLKNYREKVPFFISGGVSPEDSEKIFELRENCPALAGVDINSRFEIKPGLKNVAACSDFSRQLQVKQNNI